MTMLRTPPQTVREPGDPRLIGESPVVPIRTPAPGRVRIQIRGLYRSEPLRLALEGLPARFDGLQQITANPLTGNALILFDPARPVQEIVDQLDRWVRTQGHAFQRRPLRDQARPQPDSRKKDAAARRSSKHAIQTPAGQDQPRDCWHTLDGAEVLVRLSTEREGLSADLAAERRAVYGRNVLSEIPRRPPLLMFLEQFASPPVALLGLSAVVSVATGGIVDAAVILGVVVINAVIGYVTEAQAEKTINALSHLGPTHATVVRTGKPLSIAIDQVVPGDILALSPGSYIAADARLLSSNQLSVDESALTGESLPVVKKHGFVGLDETPLGDRKNMLHMGTVVTGGSGLAVVVATGKHTEIGLIQSLVGEVKTPDTPLQRQLDDMGMQLAILSGGICAAVFGVGVLRGIAWLEMLKSAISLAVAAVPEGLPTVATTTLALGIREMQRKHVLIRQLPAVESLGSVQTLCFDKTGTLTENRMRVVAIETPSRKIVLSAEGEFWCAGQVLQPMAAPDLVRLIEVAALCSEVKLNGDAGGPPLEGSPTETALVEIALHAGQDVAAIRCGYPMVKTVHRAEGRPYMATVHRCGGTEHLIAVKGSPAEVLALCEWRLEGATPVALDEAQRAKILDQNERLAGQALRVLAMAYGHSSELSTAAVTRNLIWIGLAGLEDSIRPGMAELIAQFHEAGIETVMITGDQSATAFSVGQRLGLSHGKPLEIIESSNLAKLDPQVLKSIVSDTTVFARVSPAHKLRIVQALQQVGRVVAMTGDGINDGPALKAADVGVALGEKGTEVARAVADVVLEDDNLHTMIIAVQQGRTIYRNIRKSLQYLLSSNLSEIEIMLIGTAIGAGEVLNPIQLLWINLITDILPALGLALEPPESDVLKESPRDPREAILRRRDLLQLLRQSAVISAGTLGVYGYSLARYGAGASCSTNSFMTLTLAQLLHAISCRSEKTSVAAWREREGNRFLTAGITASLALQVAAAFVPPLRNLLRLSPIGPADWMAIATGAVLPFVVNESIKHLPSADRGKEITHENEFSVHLGIGDPGSPGPGVRHHQ